VVFVYRDELYNPETEDQGIAELIIAKHRNGETGMIKLVFLGDVTSFKNLARQPAPPGGPPF
jgi:replicative DNA helicase